MIQRVTTAVDLGQTTPLPFAGGAGAFQLQLAGTHRPWPAWPHRSITYIIAWVQPTRGDPISEAVLHPLFSRERTIAMVGFSRWLVPPAILTTHLCIGMAYGFSVFWLSFGRALSTTKPPTCDADISLVAELFITICD